MNRKTWRPALAGGLVLALLVATFGFAPTRAAARQLLSVFRVNRFAVIAVNPDEATMDQLGQALEDTLGSREPEVLVDEPVVEVGSIAEASELAGFDVRMPSYLPGSEAGDVAIEVKGRTEVRLAIPREALVAVLRVAGMDETALPEGIEEAEIYATLPSAVHLATEQVEIVQAYEPQIDYPEGIDPRVFGEAGLRLMGLDEGEARRISERIDWTSTLVLPLPTEVAEFRELEIDGRPGVMLQPRYRHGTGDQTTILWERNGIVNVVSANLGSESLIQIAESLY